MIEHRLIERMVGLIEHHANTVREGGPLDHDFLAQALEFMREYADRIHHGKEEAILFKTLDAKPLSAEHRGAMSGLVQDHVRARGLVRSINDIGLEGSGGGSPVPQIMEMVALYRRHIATEDHEFFVPVMRYLAPDERDRMMMDFRRFDSLSPSGRFHDAVSRWEREMRVAPTPGLGQGKGVWRCRVCGYLYDPEIGDEDGGIPPGTPFEDLPEDWVCPVCGAAKEAFDPI